MERQGECLLIFSELDSLISEKYDELERCSLDQSEKEETLRKNQKILEWIESCVAEIYSILEF